MIDPELLAPMVVEGEKSLDNFIQNVLYECPDEDVRAATHDLYNAQMKLQKALKKAFPLQEFDF